jgi:hypothetical protein
VTVAAPIEVLPFPAYVSARASYVGLFLDGFAETGTALDLLTVEDRDVGMFNFRGQLTVPQSISQDNGRHTHIEWRAGIDARSGTGSDSVNALVAGAPLVFSADVDDTVSGFAGFDLMRTSADGMKSVALSGEVQSGFDGGFTATSELKASLRF